MRKKKQWENEELLEINRCEPCTDFHSIDRQVISLNGSWQFCYLRAPEESPEGFERLDCQEGKWETILVPSCWQMEGYGQMHYTDVWYLFPIHPPYVPSENPTGIYRRRFCLGEDILAKETYLRFDGVSSAFDVWINGEYVGYSKGSRLGATFLISSFLKPGENSIVVRVYQWSDGTYLECQDMWWYSGIFRDVSVVVAPKEGVRNYVIETDYVPETKEGILRQKIETSKLCTGILWQLKDDAGAVIQEGSSPAANQKAEVEVKVEKVVPWSAELPQLYTLKAEAFVGEDKVETVEMAVGFTKIEVLGQNFYVNGEAILFNGVNMHDFSPSKGGTVCREEVEKNLQLMKQCNINAIRCSHYPKASYFYELCDRYGFYVIDEADLETHGFEWIERYTWLNNMPSWKGAFVDRSVRMVKEHRNHPCIIMWSLGNESSVGDNLTAAAQAVKSLDSKRLIHYEGDARADITDVYSTMYTRLDKMEEIALGNDGHHRPHILCEYAHAMGNGPGNLENYQALFRKYDRLQGGFIWEWFDHGIERRTKEGKIYYAYGGDFGEDPHNGNFCIDGLLCPDCMLSTGLLNYKQVICPWKVEAVNLEMGEILIRNENYFVDGENIAIVYKMVHDQEVDFQGKIEKINLQPQEERVVSIPMDFVIQPQTDYYLEVEVRLNKDMSYASRGHILGRYQFLLPQKNTELVSTIWEESPLQIVKEKTKLLIRNNQICAIFDQVTGKLGQVIYKGKVLMEDGPKIIFDRAPIDNDMYKIKDWYEKYFIHLPVEELEEMSVTEEKEMVTVTVKTYCAPLSMAFGFKGVYQYQITKRGEIRLSLALEGVENSPFYPEFLPRLGVEMRLTKAMDKVSWYGLGPEENYVDMKAATYMGIYEKTVQQMHVNYVFPQENGHREEVEYLSIGDGEDSLLMVAPNKMGINVHDYTIEALKEAKHSHEIKKADQVVVHLDVKHSGLGSNSCGEEQIYPNKTRINDYHMEVVFLPCRYDKWLEKAKAIRGERKKW